MIFRWISLVALGLALSSCAASRDAPTRQFSGVWLYEFEGSTFLEGASEPTVDDPPYSETDWLEYPPDLPRLGERVEALEYDDDRDCYPVQAFLIDFTGHRTRRLGGSGHLGLWRSEVTVHRTRSIKRLGAPFCYPGQATATLPE